MRPLFRLRFLLVGVGITLFWSAQAPSRAAEENAATERAPWRLVSHDTSVIARPGNSSSVPPEGPSRWRSVGFGESLAVEPPANGERAPDDATTKPASRETIVITGVTQGTTFASSYGTLEVGPESHLSIAENRVQMFAGMVRVTAADDQALHVTAGERKEVVKSGQAIQVSWPTRSQAPEVTEVTTKSPPVQHPLGLGQLVIGDAQADSQVRLKVARYHVNVVLQPPMALVQIDQSFYNPYPAQQQGTFAFSLPTGASVSRFAMYVTPRELIEGEVIERQRARQVYDSIVNRRRDPAILEEIGPNQFRMQVFPIFGNDTKRVLLDFTVPMEAVQGIHRFRLPLLADRDPIWDFQLKATVRGARLDTVHSPTHRSLRFENDEAGGEVRCRIEQRMFTPESDFALTFQAKDEESTVRRYVAAPLPKSQQPSMASPGTYSYFQATLPGPEVIAEHAVPADILILVDTATLVKQRAHVRAWARLLSLAAPRTTRIQLACADSVLRPMTTQWCAPGSQELDEGLARLANEFFLGEQRPAITLAGAMELFAHAKEGQEEAPKAQGERRRLMLYVGPGIANTRWPKDAASPAAPLPTPSTTNTSAGEVEQAMIEKMRQAGVRFVAVLTDDQQNSQAATRQFAEQSGGYAFDGSLPEQQARVLAWLANGVAWPVRVISMKAGDSESDDLFAPAAVFPGEPLRVLGRCRGDITHESNRLDGQTTTSTQQAPQEKPSQETSRQEKPRQEAGRQESENEAAHLYIHFEGEKSPRALSLGGPQKIDDLFVGRLWAQARLQYLKRLEAADRDPVASSELAKFGDKPQTQAVAIRSQMIELSQEWSVLSPHTAFLVLESERDYASYGFVRRPRRQYWSPAGKELSEPLPPEWLATVRPDESKRAKLATLSMSQSLARARKSLAAEQFQDARAWLAAAAGSPEAAESNEYRELKALIEEHLLRHQLLERVSGRLPVFAPERASTQVLDCSPDSLLLGLRGSSHPRRLYDRLNKRVEPMVGETTLSKLAEWAERTSGIPVDFDKTSIEASAIGVDTPLSLVVSGSFTLENYLHLALDQFDLTLVEDDDRLLILTQDDGMKRSRRIEYPVADLVRPRTNMSRDRLEMLASEQWKLQQHQRLLQKLERPLSFQFRDEPLESVLTKVAAIADVPLFVDLRRLEDEGLPRSLPVTARAHDLPARKAFERVLNDSLAVSTRGEAVIITSKDRANSWSYPRVHSVRGVLTETRRDSDWPWSPQIHSTQGIGGGLGGLSGFGGGMGGGMGGTGGGMGGGMGGMGGTFGVGSRIGLTQSREAAMEDRMPRIGLGVDPEVSPVVSFEDARSPGPPTASDAPPPRPTDSPDLGVASTASESNAARPEDNYRQDWIELTDLVRNTVTPGNWVDNGGTGVAETSPATLDLVISGTDRQHREVESLLARLRREPLSQPARRYVRKARTPLHLPADAFDEFQLSQLIENTTGNPSPGWVNNGGTNIIELDLPRAMLVIDADPRSHDAIHTLLTQLHRSRYELLHGSRPWEDSRSFLEASTEAAPPPQDSVQHAAELALLKVRATSEAWTVRQLPDQTPRKIEVVSSDDVVEVRFPTVVLRMDGRDGAILSPAIQWGQVGEWGEALRRVVDAFLPWMPHRTNEDLARRFDITREREDATTLTLRFISTRSLEVREEALTITYDKQTGRVVAMKAQTGGETLGVLATLASRSTKKAKKAKGKNRSNVEHETLFWTNAHGRRAVEWTREALSPQRHLMSLDKLRNTFAILDQRPNVGRSSRLALAWKALREQRDAEAFLLLTDEIREQGPVVATCFLRAWCAQRDPEFRSRADVLNDLRFVVLQGSSPWADQIQLAEFPVFTDSQFYDLLSLMPQSRRSARDEERLAHLAWSGRVVHGGELQFRDLNEDPFSDKTVAERPSAAAFHHIRASIEKTGLAGCSWSTLEFGVRLAVKTGQLSLARDWAVGRAELGKDSAKEVSDLAAELDQSGQRAIAESLVDTMLKHPHVRGWDRRALLLQGAAWRKGLPRWRMLVGAENSAHERIENAAAQFEAIAPALTRELILSATLDDVAQLVALAKSPTLKAHLLWLRGDIHRDVDSIHAWTREAIASTYWPRQRLAHRCERLLHLKAPERVVILLETLLRRNEVLPPDVLAQLQRAYKILDRPTDAARAQ